MPVCETDALKTQFMVGFCLAAESFKLDTKKCCSYGKLYILLREQASYWESKHLLDKLQNLYPLFEMF